MYSPETRQTELIKAMRFPLIVMVLYAHSILPEWAPLAWSLEGHNVFRIFTEVFAHYIGGLALCWFFFFSGFLFYYNLQEGQYGKEWVAGKWKRRVRSILLPYIIWNLFNVVWVLFVTKVFSLAGITMSSDPMDGVQKGPVFWFFTGPIDFPLWYLRDLIVLSLFAPLLYYPVKKWPWITLCVLLALYWGTFFGLKCYLLPGLCFFGIGAWMSIRKDNLVEICHGRRYSSAICSVVLLIVTTLMYNAGFDNNMFLLFAPFGMMTFMNFCNWLFEFEGVRRWLLRLTETVFFIYAVHEIYILGWTKGLFLRVLGDALWAQWISYLFVPVVTLIVCLGAFYVFKRITPRTMRVLCGFRTTHRVHDSYSDSLHA